MYNSIKIYVLRKLKIKIINVLNVENKYNNLLNNENTNLFLVKYGVIFFLIIYDK